MTAVDVLELLIALVVSSVLLGVIAWSVWWLDRYDREPLHLMAAAFGWGAVAAPLLCLAIGPALSSTVPGLMTPTTTMVLAAPMIEELAKALGVLLISWRSGEFDNPTDGIVYGAAAGLGFAATENAAYCLAGSIGSGGLVSLVLQRVIASAGVHALASSAFGGFVGAAALSRTGVRRVAWTGVGLMVAIVMHVGWNLMLVSAGEHGPRCPAPHVSGS